MLKKFIADFFNTRGQYYLDNVRDYPKAEKAFLRAASIAPTWSSPYFNLGLMTKWQREWQKSLDWNRKAVERDPKNEGAWWNLGIAATALENWPEARRAWSGYGIELPPGDGEIVMQLGPTPIRLDPQGAGEVVWCRRIDPARAIIQNIPFHETGYQYGDVLLHDGSPNGHRLLEGRSVPVFDVIERLQSSQFVNFEIEVQVSLTESMQALFDKAVNESIGLEDWGSVRCLCSKCSKEGPPANSDQPEDDAGAVPTAINTPIRLMSAAPNRDRLKSFLNEWVQTNPGAAINDIRDAH